MKISRRFSLALSAASILIVVVAGGLTYRVALLSAAGTRVALDLQRSVELDQKLRQSFFSEVSRLHDHVEGQDAHLAEEFPVLHAELGQMVSGYLRLEMNDTERRSADQIRDLHREMGLAAGRVFEEVAAGKKDGARNGLRQVEALAEQIDLRLDSLNASYSQKVRFIHTNLDDAIRIGAVVVATLAGGLVALVAMFSLLLRRTVLEPVRAIQDASDVIRQGNLAARAPVGREDELGDLARGFNFMAAGLEESHAGLERKVEERTQEVRALAQRLDEQARLAAMGKLVSGVAHELNNPLAAILGAAEQQLAEQVRRGSSAELVRTFGEIMSQAERCRLVVANLQRFAGGMEPRFLAVRLNAVVERALALLAPDLERREVEVFRDLAREEPRLVADPGELQQVIENLLSNARDAVLEASEARGEPGRIEVRTRTNGELVTLEVIDNGPGIREPARIFDPFYTTKEVGKGAGLSLSVCYGIVKDHHGEISGENLEKGALLRVVLPVGDVSGVPVWEPVSPLSTPASPVASAGSPPRRVLVVEDEASVLRLQLSLLKQLSIEATGVSSGQEAVRALSDGSFDLVISDIRMPGKVDGLALYEWVRANRPDLANRFLFVTGDVLGGGGPVPPKDVPKLQKPFNFKEYAGRVRSMLENPAGS